MMKKVKAPENIYDLTHIGGKSVDVQVDKVPVTRINYDQDEMLTDYKLIPPENWLTIPIGMHIRYLRQDGEFRKGGFITNVCMSQDKEGNETIKFGVTSDYSISAIKWSLLGVSVDKIWGKAVTVPVQNQALELVELNSSIKFCRDSVESLKRDIQKINNEQMRIVSLIKSLHNIK